MGTQSLHKVSTKHTLTLLLYLTLLLLTPIPNQKTIKMRPAIIAAFVVASVAYAVDAFGTIVSGTGAASGGSVILASGSGVGFGVAALGVLLLKALALGALYIGSRAKRSALDETEEAFAQIAATEPAACYRRLICDMATGNLERSENEVILSLFNKERDVTSPLFDYQVAAQVGKQFKNVQACEVRYSCPLTGAQIQKLFA